MGPFKNFSLDNGPCYAALVNLFARSVVNAKTEALSLIVGGGDPKRTELERPRKDDMHLEDLYRLLRTNYIQAQGIVDTLAEPMLVIDQTGRVQAGNRAFFEKFRLSRDDTVGQPLFTLSDGRWNIPELRKLLDEVITKSVAVIGYEVDAEFPTIGHRTILLSARRLIHLTTTVHPRSSCSTMSRPNVASTPKKISLWRKLAIEWKTC